MINIDFVDIDIAKMLGRILPFWARGRRISRIMEAIISPILVAHKTFKEWATEKYIASHITAQKASLEWYLNHQLRKRFKNSEHGFHIVHGTPDTMACFSGTWNNDLYWSNELKWDDEIDAVQTLNEHYCVFNTGFWENDLYWNNDFLWENEPLPSTDEEYLAAITEINVFTPEIEETEEYTYEDYKRDIRFILSQYVINFKKVNIIILISKTSNDESL